MPRAVVLDEAVELAKSYGNDESSAFVNGVLNQSADALGRADEPRPPSEAEGARMDIRFLPPELRAPRRGQRRGLRVLASGATSARCAASPGCSTGGSAGG